MEVIIFLSGVFLCLMYYQYRFVRNSMLLVQGTRKAEKWEDKKVIALLILGGLILRVIFGKESYTNASDLNNLKWIAGSVLSSGYKSVFESGVTISLPPLVVHMEALIGQLCKLFGYEIGDVENVLLFRLPSILCDLGLAVLIYKIAKRNFTQRGAVLLSVIYLMNPATLLDSSMWGQTDALWALAAAFMCWFIYEKKLGFAVGAFTLGVLFQPYMLVLTPVLIIALIDAFLLDKEDIAKHAKETVIGLAASIIGAVLICLPMGISNVWKNVVDCYKSLPYSTVNAYNLWTAKGLNWSPDTTKCLGMSVYRLGMVLMAVCLIAGIVYHYFYKKKYKDRSSYIFLSAFLIIAAFLFGARVHERYLFAGMGILLLSYVVKPRLEYYVFYAVITILQFANMIFVFYVYDVNKFNPKETVPDIVAKLLLISFAALVVVTVNRFLKGDKENIPVMETEKEKPSYTILASEKIPRWTKYDTIILFVIMVAYSGFALHDIGYRYAPQTAWTYYADTETYWSDVDKYAVKGGSNEIILDFGETKSIKDLHYFLGNYENREFSISTADSIDGPWSEPQNITMVSVFAWGYNTINTNSHYLKLTCNSTKASIKELALVDQNNNLVKPVNADQYPNLFDEQDIVPERSTFRDSTYFDEIYHARTAWEFTQGFASYENTHPPLGKIIMSLGIRMFGMNPFGWRIMGILFGIGMLPFFYLFSKRFFKETWIAGVATTLFAFDFMHFAQTRIATIDVFVTFFIIVMYYFMYKYYKMSFYDTSLKKTFVTLGLCGFTMGLAMASKWTGVYAAAGLAIIFFVTLARRYREYRVAKANPEGSSNGISHEYIIKNFPKLTTKTILFCMAAFVLVPGIIYTLSYLPFRDYQDYNLITRMIKNQITMFTYHQGVHQEHPYSSRWWQWPIMYRPIWYFSGHVSDTVSEGISAFGNPCVWWAGIVAFFYLLNRAVKQKDRKSIFLIIGYLAQYLPWVLISRTTFIYHYFTSVPFVTLMVAYSLYLLVQEKKINRKLVYAYVALAVVLFCMFYPVLSGQPVNKNYVFKVLRWFNSWVLVS